MNNIGRLCILSFNRSDKLKSVKIHFLKKFNNLLLKLIQTTIDASKQTNEIKIEIFDIYASEMFSLFRIIMFRVLNLMLFN